MGDHSDERQTRDDSIPDAFLDPEAAGDPHDPGEGITQLRGLKHAVVNLRVAVQAYTLRLSQHTVAIADLHRRRVRFIAGLYLVLIVKAWLLAIYVNECAAARYTHFLVERGIEIPPASWCGYVVPVISHRFNQPWPTGRNLAGLVAYLAVAAALAWWWRRAHRTVKAVEQEENGHTDTCKE